MGPGGTQRHLGAPPGPEGQGLTQEGAGGRLYVASRSGSCTRTCRDQASEQS